MTSKLHGDGCLLTPIISDYPFNLYVTDSFSSLAIRVDSNDHFEKSIDDGTSILALTPVGRVNQSRKQTVPLHVAAKK